MDYSKLLNDLKAARQAALAIAESTPDDYPCNFDAAELHIPYARENRIEDVLELVE